jgi:hypothetical protein
VTGTAITELAPAIGVRAACDAAGAAQAGYYRRNRRSAALPRPAPVPHRDRAQPRALTLAEQQAILHQLHSDRFADMAPAEVWATLLDEGVYLGSVSTFYRRGRACSPAPAQHTPSGSSASWPSPRNCPPARGSTNPTTPRRLLSKYSSTVPHSG